jgi:hypothetical protein
LDYWLVGNGFRYRQFDDVVGVYWSKISVHKNLGCPVGISVHWEHH